MSRYNWKANFVNDYIKLNRRVDRLYGEREYDDPFRPEKSPGMLVQSEPDYSMHIKPYQPVERSEPVQSAPENLHPLQPGQPISGPVQPSPAQQELSRLESEYNQIKNRRLEPMQTIDGEWR